MKKLTLSADERVIEQAKSLAARQGTSVSAMFGRLVRALSERGKDDSGVPAGSIAAKAAGTIRLPKGKTTGDVLSEALAEKYGARK